MPNIVEIRIVQATAALPHAVPLPTLSARRLGARFGMAFEACRLAARAVAGEGWTVSALHEPGVGTSHVFRFACPMASFRFSAAAAAALARCDLVRDACHGSARLD